MGFLALVFYSFVSLGLIRSQAAYSEYSKLKYIDLKSRSLAKILIPKQSGYVRVAERTKISVFSLVFYILYALHMIVILAMFVMPEIPCDPFVARFGRRGQINWTIHTLNAKIIVLLPIIFFLIELITFFSMGLCMILKNKTEPRKSITLFIVMILLMVGFLVFFFFELLG